MILLPVDTHWAAEENIFNHFTLKWRDESEKDRFTLFYISRLQCAESEGESEKVIWESQS